MSGNSWQNGKGRDGIVTGSILHAAELAWFGFTRQQQLCLVSDPCAHSASSLCVSAGQLPRCPWHRKPAMCSLTISHLAHEVRLPPSQLGRLRPWLLTSSTGLHRHDL